MSSNDAAELFKPASRSYRRKSLALSENSDDAKKKTQEKGETNLEEEGVESEVKREVGEGRALMGDNKDDEEEHVNNTIGGNINVDANNDNHHHESLSAPYDSFREENTHLFRNFQEQNSHRLLHQESMSSQQVRDMMTAWGSFRDDDDLFDIPENYFANAKIAKQDSQISPDLESSGDEDCFDAQEFNVATDIVSQQQNSQNRRATSPAESGERESFTKESNLEHCQTLRPNFRGDSTSVSVLRPNIPERRVHRSDSQGSTGSLAALFSRESQRELFGADDASTSIRSESNKSLVENISETNELQEETTSPSIVTHTSFSPQAGASPSQSKKAKPGEMTSPGEERFRARLLSSEGSNLTQLTLKDIRRENRKLQDTVLELKRALKEKDAIIEELHNENSEYQNHQSSGPKQMPPNQKEATSSETEAIETIETIERMHQNSCKFDFDEGGYSPSSYPAFRVESSRRDRVLGVGIICFGQSGRLFHAPFVVGHPRFALKAVYERSKDLAQQFATRHSIRVKTCREVEDLVRREDVDVVIVCSPISMHFHHAKLALEHGKHVLVEKAFTSSSQEARELFRLAEKMHLVCFPYQNRRFDSDFRTIQRMISQVGHVTEFQANFDRFTPQVRSSWKDHDTVSGGNFLSLGSHMIDQALCLFGRPTHVWADIRAHRQGSSVDDAWEVQLFYEATDDKPKPRRAAPAAPSPKKRSPPPPPSSSSSSSPLRSSKFPNRPSGQESPSSSGPPERLIASDKSASTFTMKIALSRAGGERVAADVMQSSISAASSTNSNSGSYKNDNSGSYINNSNSGSYINNSNSGSYKNDNSNSDGSYTANAHSDISKHIHKGGFKAVLKGSLLCPEHDQRYMVHGFNGSWRKTGVDPQERFLQSGEIPPYPSIISDSLTGKPFANYHNYGVEGRAHWGVFTSSDGSKTATVPCLGSYYMLYDELYKSVVLGQPVAVPAEDVVQLLEVMELAKRSSQLGEVLQVPAAKKKKK